MLTRARQGLVCDHVHLQNQVEALLEQASLKLSSVVSDLFVASGLRILTALSEGITDPEALANLADRRLRASERCWSTPCVDGSVDSPATAQAGHEPLRRRATSSVTEQGGGPTHAGPRGHGGPAHRGPRHWGEAAQALLAELGPHATLSRQRRICVVDRRLPRQQ